MVEPVAKTPKVMGWVISPEREISEKPMEKSANAGVS